MQYDSRLYSNAWIYIKRESLCRFPESRISCSSWCFVSIIRNVDISRSLGCFLLILVSICFFFSVSCKSRQLEYRERGERFSCPRCYSSFSKKGNMLTHFRHECGKEPRFQCPYCGKKDRKSSNTYRHIRMHHRGNSIQAYRLYWTTSAFNVPADILCEK